MKNLPRCKVCKKQLSRSNAIHCSKHRPRIGSHNSNWGGGLIEVKCDYCKEIKKIKRKELKLKHHFCNRECNALFLKTFFKEENNPFYGCTHTLNNRKIMSLAKGGTGIPGETKGYNEQWNKYLKEKIRNRDNYKCRNCDLSQENSIKLYNRVLDVHHIDYDKKNCNKSNLISTCISCNSTANSNRDYWFAYYTYIIENSI